MRVGLFGPFDLTARRGNSIRILLQAQGLQKNGFTDFTLFGYKTNPSNNNIKHLNVDDRLFPKMLPVLQKIQALPVDIVHTHHFYGTMVLKQKYIIDMPSIISLQIEAMYKNNGPIWKKILLRKILNPLYIKAKEISCIENACAVIVASREIQTNLENHYGLKKQKYYLVNNPVDLDKHKKADLNDFIIGLSASDFRDSMDSYCLKVLHEVSGTRKDIKFLVAGKTSEIQKKQFANLENVEFLGSLTYEDYIGFLSRISVFLMPYLGFYDYGGSKFKLLEAGASQLPIICSDFGAIGFDYKDRLCIANTVPEIIEWIETLKDKAKRQKYGKKIYQVIDEHFNYKTEAKKLIDIYQKHAG